MAAIRENPETKIYQIQKWLGLNESPDGDTQLKLGEAARMRNFCVTRENHLQIRPGYAKLCTLVQPDEDGTTHPVRGMWSGYVDGTQRLVAACNGHLWEIDPAAGTASDEGQIDDGKASFFGFSNKLYILTGAGYYVWDGTNSVSSVEGYIPTVATATPPSGGGTLLQDVNKLTGKKRQVFSPDGTDKEFFLVEDEIDEIISVEGTEITYTADLTAGKLTFTTAPEKGTNTITITWRKGTGDRSAVTGMRFAELYNGGSDSRVFLYGDGSNQSLYSGIDGDGVASAEYFPDLNVVAVGEANTPITGMIRHYDRLLIFKSDAAYSAIYSTLTLADNRVTAAFYVDTLNREIGCHAPGQMALVNNNARTLYGNAVYEWALVTTSTRDERNAKRVSDPVTTTLSEFSLGDCVTFDDNRRQEYYILWDGKAVVNHYGNKSWYYYDDFPASAMAMVESERYFGTPDGEIMRLSRDYHSSDTRPIDAYWESGAMDFDRDWRKKNSVLTWTSIKPEVQARVTITAESNRRSDYIQRVISSNIANFTHVDFNHWSFRTNQKPQVIRQRVKVHRATYYKLIYQSNSASATATILAADIRVGYGGNVH